MNLYTQLYQSDSDAKPHPSKRLNPHRSLCSLFCITPLERRAASKTQNLPPFLCVVPITESPPRCKAGFRYRTIAKGAAPCKRGWPWHSSVSYAVVSVVIGAVTDQSRLYLSEPRAMEKCTNCESMIGNLETPYLWEGSVVCKECHLRLKSQPEEIPEDDGPPTIVTYAGDRTQRRRSAPTGMIDRRDITEGVAMGIGKVIGIILLVGFILAMIVIMIQKSTT